MAIHRRFLYPGLFLVAVGGVLVAADLTSIDDAALRGALRLWPLAVIAIGVAILVRRTRLSLPAGVLAAVAPGLLLGGTIVAGPRIALECSHTDPPATSMQREGQLFRGSVVSLATGCGSSTIRTVAGDRWALAAGSTDGREPDVETAPQALSIASPGRGGRQLVLGDRREAWDVLLPTVYLEHLSIGANANAMDVQLHGASLGSLYIEANASTLRLDATGAALNELSVTASFSNASIVLPATRALAGHIGVNAGSVKLCQPIGAGMRIQFAGEGPRDIRVAGITWTADTWTSGNVLAENQIELVVDATFGSTVEINPLGGC